MVHGASHGGVEGRLFEGNLRRIVFRIYKRPIEIDIPGKVGPQQNQRNNGSAGVCTFTEHENNG